MNTYFSPVLVLGRPGQFTFSEVTEIPNGFCLYNTEFGSIITSEPLPLSEKQLQPEHVELCAGDSHTLKNYLAHQGGKE